MLSHLLKTFSRCDAGRLRYACLPGVLEISLKLMLAQIIIKKARLTIRFFCERTCVGLFENKLNKVPLREIPIIERVTYKNVLEDNLISRLTRLENLFCENMM